MTTFISFRKPIFLICACLYLLSGFLQSCKEDELVLQNLVLEMEDDINAFPGISAAGETKTFGIICSTQWTVESNKSWCIVNPTAGTGNGSVTVIIESTEEPTTRTAFIKVKAANLIGEITVTQEGTELGVSTSAIANVSAGGTVTSFDITTTAAWTITSSATWCSVIPESGTGDRSITVMVEPTTEAVERSATLVIVAGAHTDYVTVTQEGATVELSTNLIEAVSAGTTTTVTLTANTPWTASSNQTGWCHVTPSSGSGNGILTITVDPNTSITTRTATITVVAGALSGIITVNQERIYNRLSDSLALVDIYNAVGMEDATTGKWDLNAPLPVSGTSTDWTGVRINAQGRVDSIVVAASVIPATVTNAYLPESIGDLTELRWLAWAGNATSRLTGPIPDGIGKLTKLIRLTLTTHAFTGSIPDGIGNLTEMINISMANSTITGAVPASIGNLTKLTDINLSGTGITSLPIEMGNCVNMVNFMCFGTQLTSLPEIFGNWTKIGTIMLNGTSSLTGPLPASMGSLTHAFTSVFMYNCSFTGTIPASWANLNCNTLRIEGNKLSGEIPAEVKTCPKWASWFALPAATPNVGAYICPQQAGFGFTNCN